MCNEAEIRKAITSIIKAIGEDPERGGLVDTPERMAKMYAEPFLELPADLGTVERASGWGQQN